MSEGELLTGDGVTQGSCGSGTRCGGPLRPFSLTVQAYLAHLRDAGFTGAPLPFGVDEKGREMLSFVPGDVPRNVPGQVDLRTTSQPFPGSADNPYGLAASCMSRDACLHSSWAPATRSTSRIPPMDLAYT